MQLPRNVWAVGLTSFLWMYQRDGDQYPAAVFS